MINVYSIRDILDGKNRLMSFQSIFNLIVTVIAIFVCYRKDEDVWKSIAIVIFVNVILIWLQAIFNKAVNRVYLDKYDADVAQQAEELASMVTQKKIFKETMIKDVLEKLAEEEGK